MRILARLDLLGLTPNEWMALSSEGLKESFGLREKQIRAIEERKSNWLQSSDEVEKRLAALNVALITAADASYPEKLDAFDPDPPPAVFCYGNRRLLGAPTFSVLSSRNTKIRGLELIESLAEKGVFNGETLVTSHDKPEYQRSAVVPLRWGSPRILVLDRGMFRVLGENLSNEPFRAARLWRYQFDPKTDLALSPFRPDAPFRGVHNQVRDRLVAALSDRIDFVEVAPGGNMDKLARMALQAGRKVRVSDRADVFHQLRSIGAEPIAAD